MIQARLTVSCGMNTATQKPNSNQRVPGISVRASNHATPIDTTIPITSRATDKVIELPIAPARPGSVSAACQLAKPHDVSRANCPSWKLSTTISPTGATTSRTMTASMAVPTRLEGAIFNRHCHAGGARVLLRLNANAVGHGTPRRIQQMLLFELRGPRGAACHGLASSGWDEARFGRGR